MIRNIEVIGQAVKDFGTDDLLADYVETPWDKIAGMRNILAHHYLGVDVQLTWDVIERDIPKLKRTIMEAAKDMKIDLIGE